MRNTISSSLWSATAYLVLGARALPRPHPAATYQVVDVGGSTSSSSVSADIIYKTVAITKTSKPKTVTESPVTVTVTPTTSAIASTTEARVTVTESPVTVTDTTTVPLNTVQESAETPTSYSNSIARSSLPTISLPASTITTTSQAVYAPETTSTWTSASPYVPTSIAFYSSAETSSSTEAVVPTEAPAIVQSANTWSLPPTTATHTVVETVYVAPPTLSPSASAKSAFPTFIVPWNGTQHQGNATLSASQGYSTGLSTSAAQQTRAPIDLYLAA